MTLQLCNASDHDATRIADIHLTAFTSNKMFQTQFPTPDIRAGLWHSVVSNIVADIHDPRIAVLVVRDANLKDNNGKDKAISYARYSLPTSTSNNERLWVWPEGTRLDILEDQKKRLKEAEKRILGGACSYRTSFLCSYYSLWHCFASARMQAFPSLFGLQSDLDLTYLATHPAHERRGAGAILAHWVIENCKRDKIPSYVESTSSAEVLYKKLGFKVEEMVSTILDDGSTYDRIVLTYRP